ncbi:MAG: dihydroorotase [Candidatus Coatesbacteria bacterium]|nr:dihydroorotase [Candidatus Coatesbacteria bacterium]
MNPKKRICHLPPCLILSKNKKLIGPFQIKTEDKLIIAVEGKKGVTIRDDWKLDGIDFPFPVAIPGLLDMHVHFRMPGGEESEDFHSASKAMAKGGILHALGMANTKPVIDNMKIWGMYSRKAKEFLDINLVSSITKGLSGEELVDIEGLADEGVLAFSDDGRPLKSEKLREALERLKQFKKPVLVHEEDLDLSSTGAVLASDLARNLKLDEINKEFEVRKIREDLEIVKKTKGKIHFQHVSSKLSVELLRQAKSDGIEFTAETCPHYLYFTYNDIENDLDTNKKMKPPLGSEEDRKALINAIKDGTITVIASDHAPHREELKKKSFNEAPFGVIGLETLFPVTCEILIHKEKLPLSFIIDFFTSNPAKILGLDLRNFLDYKNLSDFILVDFNEPWKVKKDEILSKSKNSPFIDRKFKTRIIATFNKGKEIYNAYE